MKTICMVLLVSLASVSMAQEPSVEPAHARVNKTMMVNFVKSLIVPGWGQWSNGHKVKAGAFLLAEVGAIAGYQINYSAGDDKAAKFKAFADEHWDYTVWSFSDNGETACGNLRTHTMPTYEDEFGVTQPIKDHHFYENISKYPEFICGWDDMNEYYQENGLDYTPNKWEYINMRTHSNELYKQAQVASTLIFINHLVSAIDAAVGTDITTFESNNYSGKFYINPLSSTSSIKLEVKF